MAKVYKERKEVEGAAVVTEAQARARQHWDATKSPNAKFKRIAERQTARVERTPQEQIALLDRRFGAGKGATKERAKLAAQIFSANG